MKRCSRCGKEKTTPGGFYRRRNASDGLQSECKDCARERDRKRYADPKNGRGRAASDWRKANPERAAAAARARRAADKERMDAVSRRWTAANRSRVNAAARKRYALNRETAIKRARQWQMENPSRHAANAAARRALLAGAADPACDAAELVAAISALRTRPCVYCGATERIEIDHIVPITRGGLHTIANLTSACKGCNTSKGNRLLEEWAPPNTQTAPNGAP